MGPVGTDSRFEIEGGGIQALLKRLHPYTSLPGQQDAGFQVEAV